MAQNLLSVLPKMSLELKLDIAYAIRNFSNCRALSHYIDYCAAAKGMTIGFLDRKVVEQAMADTPEKFIIAPSRKGGLKELKRLLAEHDKSMTQKAPRTAYLILGANVTLSGESYVGSTGATTTRPGSPCQYLHPAKTPTPLGYSYLAKPVYRAWVREPSQGWCGLLSAETSRGLISSRVGNVCAFATHR